jgi:hypothetical protein
MMRHRQTRLVDDAVALRQLGLCDDGAAWTDSLTLTAHALVDGNATT